MVKYLSLQEGSKLSDFIGYHFITDDVSVIFEIIILFSLLNLKENINIKLNHVALINRNTKMILFLYFITLFLNIKGSQYPIFKFSH